MLSRPNGREAHERTRDDAERTEAGEGAAMRHLRWLAVLPFLGMMAGPFFLNRVEPLVFGMPLLLAWLVGCTVATSGIMALIYLTDPANREPEEGP